MQPPGGSNANVAGLTNLSFRYPFRKYQRLILSQTESRPADRTYHIVAPPGSGKTIVGLELIRRIGKPTVVFAPTTTIQRQWQEKVGMFTTDDANVTRLTSLDPRSLAPINIFTYQLISAPGDEQQFARQLAERGWVDDLLLAGQAENEDAARGRLAMIQQNNPGAYREELSRRYRRVKGELLRDPKVDVGSFLHSNARELIDRLVAFGVQTIVLDECHHLLDYWAIVLRHLLQRVPGAHVIGLTATLPSPDDEEEYENYTAILGDVDFEVPTPAVVKEGDLAPYQDLVLFVQPSEAERGYLHNIQDAFELAIAQLTASAVFREWVRRLVSDRSGSDGAPVSWGDFLDASPSLAIAGLKFLKRIGTVLPPDVAVPTDAEEEMDLDDWTVLLERYGLHQLKVSQDPADHEELAKLRKILLPYGLTLTERGLRQGRSAGDLVLALSEAKGDGTARILEAELASMGPLLRIVIVTDFERMTTGVERLRGVLEQDAGSAWRIFRRLAEDDVLKRLNPVLVTGKSVAVREDQSGALVSFLNETIATERLSTTCTVKATPFAGIVEVAGEGDDWSPGTYVGLVTRAFDIGLTQCLVGTRGIFGEGWDSLRLNGLVDLTSVTTSTSVQQLRGRTIRKDPDWPRKVAHNWDVVCVAPEFARGDSDLRRFVQRHGRYWGLVPPRKWAQATRDAAALAARRPLGPDLGGQITKGVSHVDPDLDFDIQARGFRKIRYDHYNRLMIHRVESRDEAYEAWRIGDEYSNFRSSIARLDVTDLKVRTVFTVTETLKKMIRAFVASIVLGVVLGADIGLRLSLGVAAAGGSGEAIGSVLSGAILAGFLVALALNLRTARKLARAFFIEQPPDAILLDVGRALVSAMKESGRVSRNLSPDYMRVVELPDQSYQVLLDYASPEDASTFVRAYREIFGQVRDQRYLILRDDGRLPTLPLRPFWFVLRRWYRSRATFKPAYHPVPSVLSSRKEDAQIFAKYWTKYVGGGSLVFTRSEAGRVVLLRARTQRRPNVAGLAFEMWT